MMFSAPGNRLYWFLFAGMERTSGGQIPRFTKTDEAELVEDRLGDFVTETVTFGDIYEQRQISTLVAVEEHVFKRWHFGRMVTIGDAAHKVCFHGSYYRG